MQISSINFTNIQRAKAQNRTINRNFNIGCDTVSFSANAKNKGTIKEKAEEFGKKLFELYENNELTPDKILKEIRKEIPIAEIKDIRDLENAPLTSDSYEAYTGVTYGNDCELKKLTLSADFKNLNPKTIASITHEYTHCLQRYNREGYNGIAPIVKYNLMQARIINNIGAYVFAALDTHKCQENIDAFAENIKNGMDEKTALYKAYGFDREKDYVQSIRRIFNEKYEDVIQEALSEPEVAENMPFKNDPLKFRRIIKEQCAIRAKSEAEAYTVQKNVIEKYAPSEVEAFHIMSPILYQSFADALS